MDEKPAIQALERAQGWLHLPNGRSLHGFNHEYQRHGSTLLAALEVFRGTVRTATIGAAVVASYIAVQPVAQRLERLPHAIHQEQIR